MQNVTSPDAVAPQQRQNTSFNRWVYAALTALVLLFVWQHAIIIEQMIRTAFSSPQLPTDKGQWSDYPLPIRWLLLFRYGIPGHWDPNWMHILIVPFISLYFVQTKKHELATITPKPYWPGLTVVAIGLIIYTAGLYPIQNNMVRGYSAIITIAGCCLFILGKQMTRQLWLPIAYLVFAVKVSDRIWTIIATYLQGITTKGSTFLLDLLSNVFSYQAGSKGNTLYITPAEGGSPIPLNVAEACSGMRSLMTFFVLGTAMAFLGTKPKWQRCVLLASILPVAITVNTLRVTIMGLLTAYGRNDLAQGDFHVMIGLIMLVPAALAFLAIGWILDQIFIQEQSDQNPSTKIQAISKQKSNAFSNALAAESNLSKQAITGTLIGLLTGTSLFGVYLGLIFSQNNPSEALTPSVAIAITIIAGLILACILFFASPLIKKIQAAGILFSMMALTFTFASSAAMQGLTVRLTKSVLIKEAIQPRRTLENFPTLIGDWILVTKEKRLSPEIEEELGTQEYATWIYENTNPDSSASGQAIRLHIPYYTGTVDTVPHVPERCHVGAGATLTEYKTSNITIKLPEQGQDALNDVATYMPNSGQNKTQIQIPVTISTFTPDSYQATSVDLPTSYSVVYFFISNGDFLATPDHVRAQASINLQNKYAYFCKVELQALKPMSEDDMVNLVSEFLGDTLPEILISLPPAGDLK